MCDNLDPQIQFRLFGSVDICGHSGDTRTPRGHRDTNCPNSALIPSEKSPNSRSFKRVNQISEKRTIPWPDEYEEKIMSIRAQKGVSKSRNFSHKFTSLLRHSALQILVLIFLVISGTHIQLADACSARSTPKPRPPSQSAIRPNITFQTYACPPAYAAWYCLNGATCFTVKIADSILYNCECADGFMGQRCEFKDLDGSYLPTRERLMQLGNSPLGRAVVLVVAVVISLAILSAIITKWRTSHKKAGGHNNNQDSYSTNATEERNPSARYNIGLQLQQQQQQSPFTISSTHCDVIRGYNMGSSVIGDLNSVHTFNPRQRAYNNFTM